MAINKRLIRIIACFTNCRKAEKRRAKGLRTRIGGSTSTSQNSNKLREKIAWSVGRKPSRKPEHMDKDAEEVLWILCVCVRKARVEEGHSKTDILIYGRAVRQINNATFLICLPFRLWRLSFYVNGTLWQELHLAHSWESCMCVCMITKKHWNNLQCKYWW